MEWFTLEAFFTLLKDNVVPLGMFGAAVTFMWGVGRYVFEKGREARLREFETYHGLIRDLVKPQDLGDIMYVDRQCAVIFELRFYPRYDPQTLRMLSHLLTNDAWVKHSRLRSELTVGASFLEKRIKSLRMRLLRKLKPFSFFKE
ncbi:MULTISPECIES: hypothetical protein [Pseudomonas]|uniref:hypothetical protein n=1 Tax=Pseudomonas TaxID=286 RepID=UPI000B86B9C7|nr:MULTISPECIES: hypothetical protein [Pseudomonas]KAA8702869.1 hypothetical protein F4W61_10550 [Pseudomonas proteolytica]MBT9303698.1 hypothetical protein [Pseudomonas sp. TAE6080]TWR80834.1 hypothetical protein FIV38_16130 [Pseudomonas proteolytica]